MLYILTFIVAFCSIVYELLLAQTLSSTMGNTVLRYNITIGLYLASLGLGALVYKYRLKGDISERLLSVELLLSIVGALTPVLVLTVDLSARSLASWLDIPQRSFLIQWFPFLLNHCFIILIGILSGIELPILMDLGAREGGTGKANRVLVVDYMGTVLGALLFPLLLLPKLGIFFVAALTGLLNAIAALYLTLSMKSRNRVWVLPLTMILIAFLIAAIVYRHPLERVIVKTLYF